MKKIIYKTGTNGMVGETIVPFSVYLEAKGLLLNESSRLKNKIVVYYIHCFLLG